MIAPPATEINFSVGIVAKPVILRQLRLRVANIEKNLQMVAVDDHYCDAFVLRHVFEHCEPFSERLETYSRKFVERNDVRLQN